MKRGICLAIFFFISICLFSQKATSDIYGTVMLTDGSVIPGVSISLTGEKIGEMTTTSSKNGNFRFLKLSPGKYELKFDLEGFKTVIRKNIRMFVGKNITLNIQMETTDIREEIVITETPSVIDVRKTSVGLNVSNEMIPSLPTARNPWAVMNLVPGLMVDREDVGGNESGQQSVFYGVGSHFWDTAWNIDGATASYCTAPAYLDVNIFEEIQINIGSNDIDFQTGGVQLNFVTKRGGNRFSGDFHLYIEDEAWEMSKELPEYYQDQGYVFPGINRLYQYGINFGGPIIRDKWWFIGSWAIQDIHARTEVGDEDATWLANGYIKSNFQLGHTSGEFHISYSNKKKWGRTSLTRAQQDEGTLWDQDGPGYFYFAQLQHVIGNLMLTGKLIIGDGGFFVDPRGSDIDEEGHNTGADWLFFHVPRYFGGSREHYYQNYNNLNLSLDGNYFAEDLLSGDHEIRFGVDYYRGNTTSASMYPNQRILWSWLKDNPSAYQNVWLIPDSQWDVSFNRISFYLSDTANYGKLTATLGIRYDRESAKIHAYTLRPFTWHEPGSPHHGEILFPDYLGELQVQEGTSPQRYSIWSPRLSVSYDLFGDGKNVIKMSIARYGSHGGFQLAMRYTPLREIDVFWLDDGDLVPQYEELWLGDQSLDYATWENVRIIDYNTGWVKNDTDPDFNSPLLDEFSLTFEKSLGQDFAVSLTGFYKKRHNLVRQIGILPDGRLETEAENWYYAGEHTFEDGQSAPYYLRHEKPDTIYYTNYDGDTYEQYLALQLIFSKKFSHRWMLDASLTYADWKAFYNKEDFDNPNDWVTGSGDLTNYDYFNEGIVANFAGRTGRQVIVNSRWMFKLSGLYQLPWGINLTAVLNAREGYVLPYTEWFYRGGGIGWTSIFKPGTKLGDDRLPTFWMLNLGIEKTFKVSDTATATLFVDGYNITNNAITLQVETDYTAENFKQPYRVLNPGIFQVGFRLSF